MNLHLGIAQNWALPVAQWLCISCNFIFVICQAIYGLAGRQTQGFLQSLFELMKLELTAPDHSTLSRRRRQLTITLPVKDWSKPRHLVVDSTGVKVYGEGEWKVRQHGVGKRRTWR